MTRPVGLALAAALTESPLPETSTSVTVMVGLHAIKCAVICDPPCILSLICLSFSQNLIFMYL